MASLTGRRIGFLTANEGVEQVELTEPWAAVREAGGDPVLIAPSSDRVQAFHHLERADTFAVDKLVRDVALDDLDGLVLPGGVANPDALRTDDGAVDLVRRAVEGGLPVAAICHAPWMLAEAGVVDGRRLTSWPSLRTDLANAGAEWVDEPVVVDGSVVTSRKPEDLPTFIAAFVQLVASGTPVPS